MALNFGYASVRERPLNAREFNHWWIALERYNLMQTEEGRNKLREQVGVRIASGYDTDATPAAPMLGVDPVAQTLPFADTSAMLRLLDPDDPRAEFLRAGGVFDAAGNPVLSESARGRAAAVQPRVSASTQILSADPFHR